MYSNQQRLPEQGFLKYCFLLAVFSIFLLYLRASPGQPVSERKERLILLDGRSTEGKIVDIDSSGNVAFAGLNNRIELSRLHHIQRPKTEKTTNSNAKVVVDLLGGGQLLAEDVRIEDEQCKILWFDGQNLTVSIDAIRAVKFNTAKPDKLFQQSLDKPSEDFDQFFVKVDGKVEAIQGFIVSIDKNQVAFELGDDTRTLAREKLYGVVTAYIGSGNKEKMPCRVEFVDGSVIEGKLTTLSRGMLLMNIGLDTSIVADWSKVTRVTNRSDRLKYISEMQPSEAIHQPIVTLPRTWQQNKNISGRPLTLGKTVFSNGIGTSSYSRLTFETARKYERFVAVIGIDSETKGRGDCVFLVQGDGKELFRERVRGKDSSRLIRVDVKGTQEVSLIVEPGQDLDLADHANWCEARFLRLAN